MIYISGPITDSDPAQQKKNVERFYEVEALMKEPCFNPADIQTEDGYWEKYIAQEVVWMTLNHPKMYFMKGWQDSLGARIEHEVAEHLGLEMNYE
jgi:hypothetical protein